MDRENQIKVLIVVGARPNFMKAAPIRLAMCQYNEQQKGRKIRLLLVHTGQHYDELMSDRFFVDLCLPKPDISLGVGSGSQAAQTGEILKKFEDVLLREWPNMVIVVGDVNSTVACAFATAKLPTILDQPRPLLVHVEAGLRSFDRTMPEEINRIVTDQLADILFVTERSGLANLRREGIPSSKVFFVGNTMIDSLLAFKARADASPILELLGLLANSHRNGSQGSVKPYALLTLHRPSNVDEAEAFRNILEGLSELSSVLRIIFPVHPRTRARIQEFGFDHYFRGRLNQDRSGIVPIDPLGYLDFLCLMKNARLVLTDSGGVQEETTCLGIRCVTIRKSTERPITVQEGTNVIAGTSILEIRKAITRQMSRKPKIRIPEKWDGKAAQRIVPILVSAVGERVSLFNGMSGNVGRTPSLAPGAVTLLKGGDSSAG